APSASRGSRPSFRRYKKTSSSGARRRGRRSQPPRGASKANSLQRSRPGDEKLRRAPESSYGGNHRCEDHRYRSPSLGREFCGLRILAKATEALAVEKLSWRVRCAALDEILRSLRRRTDRQRCATVRGAGRSPLVRSFAPADTSDRALRGGSDRTA